MKHNFLAGFFGGVLGVLLIFLMVNITGSVGAWDLGKGDLETDPVANQADITIDAEPIQLTGSGPNTELGDQFTYQGQLKINNSPYTGNCDMKFTVWNGDPDSGGYSTETTEPTVVPVTEGLFTTLIDFEYDLIFVGDNRAIEPQVRCPTGSGSFVSLGVQSIYAVPYALSLRPGARIYGTTSQSTLVIENNNSLDYSSALIAAGLHGYGIVSSTYSSTKAALKAINWTTGGPALEIIGSIKVLDAGIGTDTPMFIHQVTSGNICPALNYATIIDNILINGNPDAILVVTPNSAGVTPPRNPIGVFYDSRETCGFGQRWAIYDLSASPSAFVVGQTFNVFAVIP